MCNIELLNCSSRSMDVAQKWNQSSIYSRVFLWAQSWFHLLLNNQKARSSKFLQKKVRGRMHVCKENTWSLQKMKCDNTHFGGRSSHAKRCNFLLLTPGSAVWKFQAFVSEFYLRIYLSVRYPNLIFVLCFFIAKMQQIWNVSNGTYLSVSSTWKTTQLWTKWYMICLNCRCNMSVSRYNKTKEKRLRL